MAPTNCGECELPLRWEQIEDRRGRGERWAGDLRLWNALGLPPRRPDYEPEDRLAAALLASRGRADPLPPGSGSSS
jgi:hypothetical protein